MRSRRDRGALFYRLRAGEATRHEPVSVRGVDQRGTAGDRVRGWAAVVAISPNVDDIARGTLAPLKPTGYEVIDLSTGSGQRLGLDQPAVLMDKKWRMSSTR